MACPTPHARVHSQDLDSLPLPYRLFGAFHNLIRGNRQLMLRRLTEHGGHPGQTFCLKVLAEDDGITQSDLAERLSVARPTVTVMLQKMEKAGLIERRSDEQDQRYTRIYLTKAGWELHEEMRRELDEMILDVVGPLSEKDQTELLRLLGALNDNIAAALDKSGHSDSANIDSGSIDPDDAQ